MSEFNIPKRKANIIINSLSGGVVPRIGLAYIAVGRYDELNAILKDIEIIEDGGSTFRLICGSYGSGKTFLLQTVKEHLLDKGFVVMDCDLSPDRLFIGTNNIHKGLSTYRKLISNASTKSSPEGGAIQTIIDEYINNLYLEIGMKVSSIQENEIKNECRKLFVNAIKPITKLVHGIEFSNLLIRYFDAYHSNDEILKNKIMKWIRGEYRLKSEVKIELKMFTNISDDDWLDYLEILAELFRCFGYKGSFVMFDEMVNVYRIKNPTYRLKNYEKILELYNNTLQGRIRSMGVILAGTRESIYDHEKGMFSYAALRSRLWVNDEYTVNNPFSPIINITKLSQSDLVILLERLAKIHAVTYNYNPFITTENIKRFLGQIYTNSTENVTTRSIVRDFLIFLNSVMTNENEIDSIIETIEVSNDIEFFQ